MIPVERLRSSFPRAVGLIEPHFGMLRKAFTFACIGVINVTIDYVLFLLGYWYLSGTPTALRLLDAFASWCDCANLETLRLVAPNIMSWLVAVTFSYTMNSLITFAQESGGRLRWRSYGTFLASGVLGAIVNTATLVIAARFMPVVAAKGCATLAGFVVNFSMSHFVVFRPRRDIADGVPSTVMASSPDGAKRNPG